MVALSGRAFDSTVRAPSVQMAKVSSGFMKSYFTLTAQPLVPSGNESFSTPEKAFWVKPPPLTFVPAGQLTVPIPSPGG